MGDKFYLCENKILCEYDYEERLVFASMANHPILKRHANSMGPQGGAGGGGGGPQGGGGGGGHPNGHPNLMNLGANGMNGQGRQGGGDHNNNLNNMSTPNGNQFGTPTHMKQQQQQQQQPALGATS